MRYDRIVNSLLDDDLYKVATQHAIAHEFPRVRARYALFNRGNTMFPEGFTWEMKEQVQALGDLMLQRAEADWLRTAPSVAWLPPPFADFLTGFRLNPSEVEVTQAPDPQGHGNLNMMIEGPMYSDTRWEVPLLATTSELRNRMLGLKPDEQVLGRMGEKARRLEEAGCDVTDFGTRRRFSYAVQDALVGTFAGQCKTFRGTSNLHFAMRHGLRAIGTNPHEWYLLMAAIYGVEAANQMALEHWSRVYGGALGTVLPDTFTTDVFLRTFNGYWARLFDGIRQDSGDPIAWGYKILRHFEKLGIDPLSKLCVFSDALTVDKAIGIKREFEGKLRVAFGIGTHLTNDCGHDPLNIVIKLVAVEVNGRWVPVAKLSDDPGKVSGEVAGLYKQILGIG